MGSWNDGVDFSDLVGKTLKNIQVSDDQIVFTTTDGEKYNMYHEQDCCENVSIDEINGDMEDLKNTPILSAEETTNSDVVKDYEYRDDSFTWTFYHIRTIKGDVTIKWYGSSNGYYSEGVSFCKVKNRTNE